MKYVMGIIGGLFIGAYSESSWGVVMGGLMGWLWAWVLGLKQKIEKLEQQLSKQPQGQAQIKTAQAQYGKVASKTVPESDVGAPEPDQTTQPTQKPTAPESEWVVPELVSEPDEVEPLPSAKVEDIASDTMQRGDIESTPPGLSQASMAAGSEARITQKTVVETSPLDDAIGQALSTVKSWVVGYFKGGNTLVRTGMLVLFVGVAFLLKYVAERTVVPVEYRYIAVVLGSLLLLGLGWRLRHKRPGFALTLQGGGLGVLYLTLFAAMRLHQLLPHGVVLLLLIVVVAATALFAVMQNAMSLAVIGVLGGFAAPILTSTGSGSHVQLFAYYLILNLSIFAMAWFKSWRMLNLLGFVATFAIGSLWGAKYYQPVHFSTVEPFLVAHFLLYVGIAVLFAFKQAPNLKGLNDGTLVFGTPIIVFALQAGLVKDMTYGLAYSALALGLFYVLLAVVLKQKASSQFKDLMESFVALGVGFGTLAIPLAFDGRVTSAMWVAEASALVWVGIRQSRLLPRFSGYGLAVLGVLAFFVEARQTTAWPFLNADFVGMMIVVFASLFIAQQARAHQKGLLAIEKPWVWWVASVNALLWWLASGLIEWGTHMPETRYLWNPIWMMVTAVLAAYLGRKHEFRLYQHAAWVIAAAIIFSLTDWPNPYVEMSQAIMNQRFLAWLIVVVFYWLAARYWLKQSMLEAQDSDGLWRQVSRAFLMAGGVLWLANGFWEIHHFIPGELMWPAWLAFVALSWVVAVLLVHRLYWQDAHHLRWAYLPLVLVLLLMQTPIQPFTVSWGWAVWLLTWAVNYWMLRVYQNSWQAMAEVYHVASLLGLAWFVCHGTSQSTGAWLGYDHMVYLAAPGLALWGVLMLVYMMRKQQRWPLSTMSIAYEHQAVPILLWVLWLFLLWLNFSEPGQWAAVPYLPLLNVIDLLGLASFWLTIKWHQKTQCDYFIQSKAWRMGLMAALAFALLNATMLRAFHFALDIPYQLDRMLASFTVQLGFSVLWAVTAVVMMVLATRRHNRLLWLAGLGLMGLVVAKLFLVDMSASGSIERIVAFLTVGVLLSVVGYFSPIPPETQAEEVSDNE